jgi:hypothetical protein
MSVIVYCSKNYCFSKQLSDKADDVLKIGWSKNECHGCGNVTYTCADHED